MKKIIQKTKQMKIYPHGYDKANMTIRKSRSVPYSAVGIFRLRDPLSLLTHH